MMNKTFYFGQKSHLSGSAAGTKLTLMLCGELKIVKRCVKCGGQHGGYGMVSWQFESFSGDYL